MKKGLLTAGILLVCLGLFAGSLTVAGAALRYPVANTVLTVTKAEEVSKPTEEMAFPVSIPETPLTAERLVVYEGPQMEQGSDEPVANVLALLLHNTGDREILKTEVFLQSKGITHCFVGSHIPAQSRILLLERNNATWPGPDYTDCSGTVQYSAEDNLSEGQIEITEIGMGEIAVTNLTNETILGVSVFHKNFLTGMDIYIGGTTYQTAVGDLGAGETVTVSPEHYASGYSKVVRVEGKLE